jgi:COP9 signalosome complex subunit 3
LKKLTATYVTLHVSDIGKAVKIDSEDDVRALLLSMVRISPDFCSSRTHVSNFLYAQIESNDICAEISASGSVTFSDPPPQFTKKQLDSVLREIQHQSALLGMLEQEMGKSKEFLSKVGFLSLQRCALQSNVDVQVVKTSDPWAVPPPDEELLTTLAASQGTWEDN